jgi:hypothetical protein
MALNVSVPQPSIATHVPGLNEHFAQPGWLPDAAETYQCSRNSESNNWTLLMVLVVSGRDSTGRLSRYDELVRLLATDTPDRPNASEYENTNNGGWTALMFAARYAGTHSTEETLRLLLAHPKASQVARQTNAKGSNALSLAVRHHRLDHVPVDELRESSDTAAMMLLDHESYSPDLFHPTSIYGGNLLVEASRGACRAFESGQGFSKTYARIFEGLPNNFDLGKLARFIPGNRMMIDFLRSQVAALQTRVDERATLRDALKEGISLPGSTVLLYL